VLTDRVVTSYSFLIPGFAPALKVEFFNFFFLLATKKEPLGRTTLAKEIQGIGNKIMRE
jgi:hypothetical protein